MFDIGGWELFVVGALALIVVGPKDLPRLVRNVGRWVAKARSLAREFQSGMEEAAREVDVAELKDLKKVSDIKGSVERELRDAASDTKRALESQAPKLDRKETTPQPKSPAPAAATAPPPAAADPKPAAPSVAHAAETRSEADDEALLRDFERGVRGDS